MESLSQRIRLERLARKIPQGTDLQESSSYIPGQETYHAVFSLPNKPQNVSDATSILTATPQEDYFSEPEEQKFSRFI